MCVSFTEHVRTYGRECDPAACVLPQLEQLLRKRMRRRNLLSAPPAYLGYDLPSWSGDRAFEDVVVDCYVFAVASRIEGLQNQLRVRANIDGLITRNVDNFLSERQSRRDPIGYAVFGNLETVVADLTASGQASVDDIEDDRLKSASVITLGFGPSAALPCDPARLHEAVAAASGWSEALAGLISTSDEGRAWMSDFLRNLGTREITCFRVSDIVSAVASRAREDWTVRHATPAKELGHDGDDDVGALVRLVWPDDSVEIKDLLEMLKRAVRERIRQERQLRVRNGLTAVFDEWIQTIEESGLSKPNQAELAERVGMADATLSDYLRRLRQIIETILPEKPEK
jgi:hypothetical protein